MTRVKYSFGKQVSVEISGHAGAKRVAGCDLCCAAESMLAYTLIDSIDRLNLKKKDIRITDGYVYVSLIVNSLKSLLALVSVRTIINGFELLQKKYPENVYVKKKKEVKINEQIFN